MNLNALISFQTSSFKDVEHKGKWVSYEIANCVVVLLSTANYPSAGAIGQNPMTNGRGRLKVIHTWIWAYDPKNVIRAFYLRNI